LRRPSLLDRFLRLFAEVRAGEGWNVLLLALNVFLLLTAYYILKPLRDGLIIGEEGPEFAAYMAAAMAFLLIPVVRGYGKLADRLPRRRLINVVTIFFAACCAAFFLLGQAGAAIGIPYFIWVGIFSVMIIAQFWGFANDLYTNEEGERLFPIVQIGGAAGGIVGAVVVREMIKPMGLYLPMLIAGGILLLTLVITNYIDRRERARTEADLPPDVSTAFAPAATGEFRLDTGEFKNLREALKEALEKYERDAEEPEADEREPEPPAEEEFSTTGAFQLVRKTPYLLYIAILVLLLNWVNTNGENLLKFLVNDVATAAVADGTAGGLTVGEYIGSFYGGFYLGVNILTALLQLFVVSRVLKYLGVHVAIMILPVIALGAYGLIALYPVLSYVRWAKTAENATDYSLNNTVRQALFLPTTREQKYKAKQVTDSFSQRAGDTLAGLTTVAVVYLLGSNVRYFAVINIAVLFAWLFVAWRIGRMYKELVATGRPPLQSAPRKAA
jgi:AAA family ATP:ADP antiporter